MEITKKLFEEEHIKIAENYHKLGITQRKLGDYGAALKSHQRALDIATKLFGEEHARTADHYIQLAITQRKIVV